jgi:hypothetical protein
MASKASTDMVPKEKEYVSENLTLVTHAVGEHTTN